MMLKLIPATVLAFILSTGAMALEAYKSIQPGTQGQTAFLCMEEKYVDFVLNAADTGNDQDVEQAFQQVLSTGVCVAGGTLIPTTILERKKEYHNIDENLVFITVKIRVEIDKNEFWSFAIEDKPKK